jgi:dephospho-CoA kinase
VLSTVIKHAREKKFNLALVAPLLIESNFTQMVDVVWVIKSDARIMVERLKREFKISEVQAFRRINAQLPISEKEAYAHYVIENNGKIEDFKRRVIKTWNRSLSDFSAGKLPLPGSSKK